MPIRKLNNYLDISKFDEASEGLGIPEVPFSFSAYNNTATQYDQSLWVGPVFFGMVEYNNGNCYNGSTRFTALAPGIYSVSSAIKSSSLSSGTYSIAIYKNGVSYKSITNNCSNGYNSIGISANVSMQKNDYIEIFIWLPSKSGLYLSAQETYFQASLIQMAKQRVPITISTEDPSSGIDGDIWIKYIQ